MEAPQIRRIFSCSPRDPRYHMLEHLSPKFRMPPMEREPRAALILNRFTRTLTVMYATKAVSSMLGVRPDQIKNKSFYECIQENCLGDALECIEHAKANDSIAYLRFWYRDPRREGDLEMSEDDEAEEDATESFAEADAKTLLETAMDVDSTSPEGIQSNGQQGERLSGGAANEPPGQQGRQQPLELEAVVSCTSDGLVVVLRKARPPIPADQPPLLPFDFENGLFVAPWAQQSITSRYPTESLHNFRPPLLPQFMSLREIIKAAGGPRLDQLMRSIRNVAVFAWGGSGINGNVAAHGRGFPTAETQFQSNRRDSGDPFSSKGRDVWDHRAVTKGSRPLGHDGPDDELDNPFHRPTASEEVLEGPHHRARGRLPCPPNQPRRHARPALGSPTAREQGGGFYSSSWTDFTDADCGRADRRHSYGVITSRPDLTDGCKMRHFRWL
ncbi:hypothetical protein VUR80DRAFT_7064 [Thermomyces stellatus]